MPSLQLGGYLLSRSLSLPHPPSLSHSLSHSLACSPSTQTDMRAAGNQQSGSVSLGVSALEQILEQQEVARRATGQGVTDGPPLLLSVRGTGKPPGQQYAVGPRSIWTVT